MTPSILMTTVQEELAKINMHPRNLFQINLNGLSGVCDSIEKLMGGNQKKTLPNRIKQAKFRLLKQQVTANGLSGIGQQ
jgi:hypothetical protein